MWLYTVTASCSHWECELTRSRPHYHRRCRLLRYLLALVSAQAPLISHSTHSAKLPFFQKAVAMVMIVEFAHIQDYEEWMEGVYARDELNI